MTKIWKKSYLIKSMELKKLSEKCEKEKKNILNCLDKFKSSIRNKYCLFCREKILDNDHYCSKIESVESKIIETYFEIKSLNENKSDEEEKIIKENKKEIMDLLNEESFKNKELFINLRNKILAYSM